MLCNYYVTYRCNATCSFCDIWERPSPYISLENLACNLKDLKKLGVRIIDFTGGEPLLHRDIHTMLRMAKEQGFITTLTTNTLLYPKKATSLQGLIDMLHFSLDSPKEEEHNLSRGVNCFQHFRESLTLSKNLGEKPDILFTVFPNNLHQIKEVWEEYALKQNLVLILNPAFNYNNVETGGQLNKIQLQELLSWSGKKNVFLNRALVQLQMEGGNQVAAPVCKAMTSTVVISPENHLLLPCYHLGMSSIPIENQLFEKYNSEKVQKMRVWEGRLPGCQGCTINCYMQPSFTVNLNRYWFLSAPSALKYNKIKGTWRNYLFPAKIKSLKTEI